MKKETLRLKLTEEGWGPNLAGPPYDTEGLSMVVLGNKGAGKSNTLAVIAEEAHRHLIPFIYYDPDGDAVSLRELGDDVIIIGDPERREPIRRADYSLVTALRDAGEMIDLVLNEGFSLVVDLSEGDNPELPHQVFQALINEHYRRAGRLRIPCFVIVDEAHHFAPEGQAEKIEKASLRALGKVALNGRKRGMLLVVGTQRATYLSKKIIFGANLRVFGKLTWFPDYELLQRYIPAKFRQMKELRSGQVFIMTDNSWGLAQIRKRETADLGKTPAFRQRRDKKRPSKKVQLQLNLFSEDNNG